LVTILATALAPHLKRDRGVRVFPERLTSLPKEGKVGIGD
jgi:hypothetical protein